MNEMDIWSIKLSALIGLLILLLFIGFFALTAGCITGAKNAYTSIMETPTPEPTPTPEITANETPAPVVTVTEDPQAYMLRTNGYHMRQWLHWFRADVQGINGRGTKDLSTYVTVYGYKFLPQYHYYSVSWGRNFLEKPEPGNQFLFIFVNVYSDGDDVRQYGFEQNHFGLQIDNKVIWPDDVIYPERRIVELEDTYDYAHVEGIKPYGYTIVQEKGTGVITAVPKEWIMGGRSNAWDGYILYQVPYNVTVKDIKVLGRFANLGGSAWWQLEENQNL